MRERAEGEAFGGVGRATVAGQFAPFPRLGRVGCLWYSSAAILHTFSAAVCFSLVASFSRTLNGCCLILAARCRPRSPAAARPQFAPLDSCSDVRNERGRHNRNRPRSVRVRTCAQRARAAARRSGRFSASLSRTRESGAMWPRRNELQKESRKEEPTRSGQGRFDVRLRCSRCTRSSETCALSCLSTLDVVQLLKLYMSWHIAVRGRPMSQHTGAGPEVRIHASDRRESRVDFRATSAQRLENDERR